MKNMTLAAIASACDGKIYFEEKLAYDSYTEASQVIIDSRQIIPKGVFIATPGERVDGHSFIGQVFSKGALAVVCQTLPKDPAGPCILVEDSFKALRDIAKYYREQLDIKVVGITGSVGKTSTKEFIASVLATKYSTWKTQGNFNNEIGLPLTILQVKEEHEVLVLEMGINHFGEMTRLSAIGKPDIAVITNIGECHLEFLGDRDGVLKAKSEIFSSMKEGSLCILNGDDDKLITLNKVLGTKPIFIGKSKEFDYYFEDVKSLGLFGSEATLKAKASGLLIRAEIPLAGEHMIYNATVAMAVAEAMGLNEEEIVRGIKEVTSTQGRSNIIKTEEYTIIDDCYNANPTSTKSAIKLLCEANTAKVAILGDMFELGEKELELHAKLGSFVATSGIDVLICIGKLSKEMYDAANKEQCAMVYYFESLDKALLSIKNILTTGDSILIKASHGMGFNKLVDFLTK